MVTAFIHAGTHMHTHAHLKALLVRVRQTEDFHTYYLVECLTKHQRLLSLS